MAGLRSVRRRDPRLAFEAIAIEGGLLSPEWLSRVARLDAGGQAEADYRVPKGLNLRDEIGRYWRIAQAHWADFSAGRSAGTDPEALAETFVTALLRDCLGFTSLVGREPEQITGRDYPVRLAALGGRVPVVIAPAGTGLEAPSAAFGDGGRRRSAFGLLQEYLNAADRARWGFASDGVTLRIARDNTSLTRPAWVEGDLGRIFTEERYADFAALWLLAHETRFGSADQPADECPVEQWREAGREEGTRAREHLRAGVEQALLALGQGFLSHPENQALRKALQDGSLTRSAYFQELLRLVYRLIFLLTIEERGLLHPENPTDEGKALYAAGYSLSRLRERSVRRSAHDRFSDLWEGIRIVFRGLAGGESRLGLPALSGLFAAEQCPNIDEGRLENRALLVAIFRLAWLRESSGLVRVNWRDMGPEELGSVYESLLELVPQITEDGRQFTFATGGETKGNARKTSGSYYTPDSLVQVLLDSALEPVVKETIAAHPKDPVAALLRLSIVDPACGSGHFLLAAARRVAAHVARLQANGTPSAAEYRHALRQVVGRCIYGVDLNPMAVELCRVSLWMEAVEPGRPLTFLDSHIQQGNALLGTTPDLMKGGIPDEAWSPFEGDDREVASALKRRNKAEREGQRSLIERWAGTAGSESDELLRAVAAVEAAADGDLSALAQKRDAWGAVVRSNAYRHQRFVADAWCAVFVWPKRPGAIADLAPTHQQWRHLTDSAFRPPALTVTTVGDLSGQYQFFHWHLQFTQVFAKGGFDVVLGNPPWERVTLKEKEWFAERDPGVAAAGTAAERLRRIAELETSNQALHSEFVAAKRLASGEKSLLRRSGAYPLCGHGDVNTFAVFAELGMRLSIGRAGLVLPTGIATTDTTQAFVAYLLRHERLVSIYDFDNRSGIFPAVQGNVRFCLMTVAGGGIDAIHGAAQLRSTNELREPGRTWHLNRRDVEKINPNTLTLPLFPSQRDASLVAGIYDRLSCLEKEGVVQPGQWNVRMQRMLHMGDDSHLFKTEDQLVGAGFVRRSEEWINGKNTYVPLLEAKLCHQFDHRAGTFNGIPKNERFGTHPATREVTLSEHEDPGFFPEPRYWVPESEVRNRIGEKSHLLGFRDAVSAVADSRSLVASVVPPDGAGDTLKFLFPETAMDTAFVLAWFNATATDFVFRLKSSGGHASFFLLRQLPVPYRDSVSSPPPWNGGTTLEWMLPRVLELTFTSWAISGFASACGYDGPPFRWSEDRRFLLRCELDAAFFHLYGLSRDDTDYVMDTFPIVRKNDEKAYGEYRTKSAILEIYDAMAEAARTGQPYVTRLDPPPADPRVAHQGTRVQIV